MKNATANRTPTRPVTTPTNAPPSTLPWRTDDAAEFAVEKALTAVLAPEPEPERVAVASPEPEPDVAWTVPVGVEEAEAPEDVEDESATKRSVDWNVAQLEEAGMRAVYGMEVIGPRDWLGCL